MEIIISILLGVGLAAACGFRVFLPLFILSGLSYFGIGVDWLGHEFLWMSTLPAMISFGVASLIELIGYYVPFVDNLLDTIAIPLAAIAGTLVSLSTMVELQPLLKWGIALIAGGGVASIIKGVGAKTRLLSSATTAGLGNPIVSTAETGASLIVTMLALFIPVFTFVLIVVFLFILIRKFRSKNKAHMA